MSRSRNTRNAVVAICILGVSLATGASANAGNPCELLDENFSTDVFTSGEWIRSDGSVTVDEVNGWLHIASDGGVNDGAHKFVDLTLPIILEMRMRLVSGGGGYTLPNLILYMGPTGTETYGNTYHLDPNRGWFFMDEWTGEHTKSPQSENTWWTIKLIIRADGGELLAKSDTDTEFTQILTRAWVLPIQVKRVFVRQHGDAVCDFDYIRVHVSDFEPPVVTYPSDTVVGNDPDQCGATVNYDSATATDNCSVASVICTPPPGTFFPVGVTTVECVAVDSAGLADTCWFDVIVEDTQAPLVTCPVDIVVPTDPDTCGATVIFGLATATDNCFVSSVICTPPSGSFFPVGVTAVECVALDDAGNTDTCTFNVTVIDTEPPVAQCPGDITQVNDPGQCDAVVSFAATATDNCPGVTIVCVPPSGTTFPVGATSVVCIATDAAGNADTCSFTVTVNETEPPVATCPSNITANTDPNECGAIVNFASAISDNCPGATIACVPPSGSLFPIGTTTVCCIATDASGKADTCCFNVTINDTEPPVVTCPSDTVLDNDPDQCGAVVNYEPATATDNCSVASLTCTPPSGSFFPVGVTAVECVAIDDAGQADTCTFTVTVNDGQPPVVACPGDTTVQSGPGGCAVLAYTADVSDNCPGSTLVCDPPSGFCFPVGQTTVECIGTDAAGNADTCTFTVKVDPLCDTLRIAAAGPTFVPGGWKVPVSLANCTVIGGGTVPLKYGALPAGWSCDSVCVQGTRLSDCEFFSYSIDPVQRTILVEWSCATCLSPDNGPLFIVCFSQTGGCDSADGDIICIDTTTIDIPPTPRRLILVNCDSPAEEFPVIFEPGCFDTPTFMSGDVTCEGVCNVIDVVRLVNVAFRNKDPMVEFCPLGLPTGDLNCDGVINVLDVVLGARCAFRGDCSCVCNAGSGGLAKRPVSKAVAKVETIQASTGRWTHTLSLTSLISWCAAQFEWAFVGEANDIRVDVGDGAAGLRPVWHLDGNKMTIGLVDIYGQTLIEPGERTVLHLSGTGDFPGITLTSGLLATEKAEPIEIAPVGLSATENSLPESFELGSNYPNPFNAGTVIPYTLARSTQVELAVYDVLGRRVRTLVDRFETPGRHQVAWDGTDAAGRELASGMYFYRLTAGDVTKSRQMVLLK